MSPYLFAQAVSVPLGLPDRVIDAAEGVLVDCQELEVAAQVHDIAVSVLRQAITVIFRQCYRIIALQLPRETGLMEEMATGAAGQHVCAYAC